VFRIEGAETDALRLIEKPVTRGKLVDTGRRRIDKFWRQNAIKQLHEHATIGFDELAVNPRNIDLPEVHARSRMPLQPGDDVQQPTPRVDQFQRTKRSFGQPAQQWRLVMGSHLDQS